MEKKNGKPILKDSAEKRETITNATTTTTTNTSLSSTFLREFDSLETKNNEKPISGIIPTTETNEESIVPDSDLVVDNESNGNNDRPKLNKECLNSYNDEILSSSASNRSNTTSSNETTRVNKRKKAISKTLANIERTMKVDLCYVLDCTGSMSNHIAAAKDCILQVMEYINNTNPCIRVQFGFCGYRDHCDIYNNSRLQVFDFTNSYQEFRNNLSTVPADGGGDFPEDVLGGLDAAITKMTWRGGTRVILHIGDAPPHGRRFYYGDDKYPDGDPYGLTAESVLEKMQLNEIHYFFGKITPETDTMIQVFRSIIGEFPVFDLLGGDPIDLIKKFVGATISSIATSVTLTSSLGSKIKSTNSSKQRRDLNPEVPNWDYLPYQKGVILGYNMPETLNKLKDQRYFKKENLYSEEFYFKIAPHPFSAGIEKYAYFAINTTSDPLQKMVMKEYSQDKSENPFEKYLEAVEISTVAGYLSNEFNSIARKKKIPLVNFLEAKVVRAFIDNETRYYVTESELNSKFKRFNANSGIIIEFHPALEAFAHFTYVYTKGYLMICDLQGIELTNSFLLTDPAIHCIDPMRFGRTNLGKKGIKKRFLANHKCNDVCRKLGIAKFRRAKFFCCS
ncbi:hypothetical protein Glove_310g22 [Diversispora epigaea]|uniref:Alpha-type protein kinase domain-containing protein n=1 Tax=Diversispora epigaea TaxID=1348612 RepID=A0A397HZA1_9GLOM|nr:hypothetical protein Glove_310g22 [Diversispora epigaea]